MLYTTQLFLKMSSNDNKDDKETKSITTQIQEGLEKAGEIIQDGLKYTFESLVKEGTGFSPDIKQSDAEAAKALGTQDNNEPVGNSGESQNARQDPEVVGNMKTGE